MSQTKPNSQADKLHADRVSQFLDLSFAYLKNELPARRAAAAKRLVRRARQQRNAS
jgi:hypothetical protein